MRRGQGGVGRGGAGSQMGPNIDESRSFAIGGCIAFAWLPLAMNINLLMKIRSDDGVDVKQGRVGIDGK